MTVLSRLTRPIVDLPDCRPTWARVPEPSVVDNLFARWSSQSVAIQVFGDPDNPYVQPFAIVQRFYANQRRLGVEQSQPPGLTTFNHQSGRSSADWLLADGTEAYLNTRNLPDDAVVALASAQQPRPADAMVPGFDLPSSPGRLQLLDETTNGIELSDAVLSACTSPEGSEITVAVLAGRPLAPFAPLIDQAPPLPVVRQLDDGRTLIAFGNRATDAQRALDSVRQATDGEWATMLAAPSRLDPNPVVSPPSG